jgi:hypothetical protein
MADFSSGMESPIFLITRAVLHRKSRKVCSNNPPLRSFFFDRGIVLGGQAREEPLKLSVQFLVIVGIKVPVVPQV